MTNPFGGSEQQPAGAPTAEAQATPIAVEPQQAPEITETPRPAGIVERLRAVHGRIEAAREDLRVLEREAFENFNEIIDDAGNILRPADKILQQVTLDKTNVGESREATVRVPLPEERITLYSTRDAKAISSFHRGTSTGTFVGADGKSIEVTRRIWYSTCEAVDTNDAEAVEAALNQSREHEQNPSSEMIIQDPVDPTLRLMIGSGTSRPSKFRIAKLDASGEWDSNIEVHLPYGGQRGYREGNMVIIEPSEGAEDIIGDPFEIARRTLDFAKSATLKPAIPATPQPTPPVA